MIRTSSGTSCCTIAISMSSICSRSRSSIRPTMPKSKQADHVARQQHDIAGMRIGMEKAVREDHLHVEVRAAAGDLFAVEAGGFEQSRLRERNAVDHVHRQDARRRKLGVGLGNADRRIVAKQLGELMQIAFFAAEIELAAERAAHLGHVGRRAIGGELGKLLGELREAGQHFQIFVHFGRRCRRAAP